MQYINLSYTSHTKCSGTKQQPDIARAEGNYEN